MFRSLQHLRSMVGHLSGSLRSGGRGGFPLRPSPTTPTTLHPFLWTILPLTLSGMEPPTPAELALRELSAAADAHHWELELAALEAQNDREVALADLLWGRNLRGPFRGPWRLSRSLFPPREEDGVSGVIPEGSPPSPEEAPEAATWENPSTDPITSPPLKAGGFLRDPFPLLEATKRSFPNPSRGLPTASALEGWVQRLPATGLGGKSGFLLDQLTSNASSAASALFAINFGVGGSLLLGGGLALTI